jgi:hypothetical protein
MEHQKLWIRRRRINFPHKNGFSILLVAKRGKRGGFCEGDSKGSVQNSTTPIFMGGGPCRNAGSNI